MIAESHAKASADDRYDVHSVAERWNASQREATDRLLELYQKTVVRLADAHVSRARAVDVPVVVTIAETQATLSRDVCDAYVKSVRKLLER
jgi:hypothetical protein